jgi:hypothetical protein
MSTFLREIALKTEDSFQEISNNFEWSSKIRATTAVFGQLEFALIR